MFDIIKSFVLLYILLLLLLLLSSTCRFTDRTIITLKWLDFFNLSRSAYYNIVNTTKNEGISSELISAYYY